MQRRFGGLLLALTLAAGCGDGDDAPPRATPTATAVAMASPTAPPPSPTHTAAAPAATATPTATGTATATASATPTSTATATTTLTPSVTLTPTPTATPRPPEITLFGVARSDDLVQEPAGVDAQGRAIYERPQGQGMMLFVEAARGSFNVATSAYDPTGASAGVELLVSRPLGDGSVIVCDDTPPLIGGVPAVDPPRFDDTPAVRDAIADLGCRVNDGTGEPRARVGSESACTRDLGALYRFADPRTTAQFCLPVAKAWSFPVGDTVVAARVRDIRGNVSATREIVIRVAGDVPFDCEGGLGERVFTPVRPASRLLTTAADGDVSLDPWVTDSLRLCAGPDLGGGQHALTLREDMRFGIRVQGESVVCGRIFARGAIGVLDCGGTVAQDVSSVAEDGTGRISTDSGLGLPAGTGSASLRAPVSLRVLPNGAAPSDCLRGGVTAQFVGGLTTAQATAEVVDAAGATLVALRETGLPFSCSDWRDGGPAALVLPVPAADTVVGDVAAVLVLSE